MSEATTRGIRVKVESEFVPDRSDPHNGEFFFAYHVKIENHGEEPVRLLSRHWIITDGMGKEQEVRGPGVVGKQPRLRPGEAFEYTSASRTGSGTCAGGSPPPELPARKTSQATATSATASAATASQRVRQ